MRGHSHGGHIRAADMTFAVARGQCVVAASRVRANRSRWSRGCRTPGRPTRAARPEPLPESPASLTCRSRWSPSRCCGVVRSRCAGAARAGAARARSARPASRSSPEPLGRSRSSPEPLPPTSRWSRSRPEPDPLEPEPLEPEPARAGTAGVRAARAGSARARAAGAASRSARIRSTRSRATPEPRVEPLPLGAAVAARSDRPDPRDPERVDHGGAVRSRAVAIAAPAGRGARACRRPRSAGRFAARAGRSRRCSQRPVRSTARPATTATTARLGEQRADARRAGCRRRGRPRLRSRVRPSASQLASSQRRDGGRSRPQRRARAVRAAATAPSREPERLRDILLRRALDGHPQHRLALALRQRRHVRQRVAAAPSRRSISSSGAPGPRADSRSSA